MLQRRRMREIGVSKSHAPARISHFEGNRARRLSLGHSSLQRVAPFRDGGPRRNRLSGHRL